MASLCASWGKQAKQTVFWTNAAMSSARTERHNNLDKDGRRRVAYREFGIHLSLATVTEKAVRWYSRSLRHLPLEQLKHWRRSSTNWRQLSASSPACTAAPLDESPASSVESRKCSCVVNGKLHVFIGESVGLLKASVFSWTTSPQFPRGMWHICDIHFAQTHVAILHKGRFSVR